MLEGSFVPMNREDFLARVKEAVHAGRMHGVETRPIAPTAGYIGGGTDLPARMAEEVNAVGGLAHVAANIDDARRRLAQLLDELRPARCLCWQHPLLDELGVPTMLESHNVERLTHDRLTELPADELRARSLAADIGITACNYAVAETGTVALSSAAGRERVASLLPPVYITLVDEAVLVPDLFDLFDRLGAAGLDTLPSNLALITGPSKTGDIELQLTTGVHGPGIWHVIIIRRK